ncbi:MAG: 3-phosphoshikimate 1-carboxyvinyltransferase [Paludibacteraceae bacterium]|nr:3-phosphoshikimate 1-carboxyvinyltransferase [Paludibacteraceae bacterium]
MESVITLALHPEKIQLEINLPASKSISNRALILNALSYSPHEVENLSDCDDTRVMVNVFDSNSNYFDVGAAGTSMRFLTAFLAKTVGEWTITGSERMKQRPIRILVDALNQLGGKVEYIENKGFPPLKIFGSALTGGEINLNGGISSQYISALMMIAPYMQKGLKINLQGNVISTPYILMTKKMMEDFGVKIDFSGDKISIRPQIYNPVRFRVESDWSAASYWYEILSLSGKGKIRLKGLKKESYQGDSEIAEIFKSLGVTTEYAEDGVILLPNKETLVKNFFLDFTNIPDLAQTVAVTCCLKDITFIFSGLQSLKIKETNRIEALIHELRKLGYVLHEPAEGTLAWNGEKCTADEDPVISTYEDHRMAMAFAPAALLQSVTIRNPSVVSKSYPNFWHDISLISM